MAEITSTDKTEVVNFLRNTFALPLDLAQDYAEVAILLSDNDRMLTYLRRISDAVGVIHQQLESELQGQAREGLRGQQNLLGKSILLLVKHFGWEVKNNYQLQGNVDAEAFKALVRNGNMWRDHISTSHGDYTHCLQWLAVYCALGERAVELYKQSVDFSAQNDYQFKRKMRGTQTVSNMTLWVFLVDCFPSAEACEDWRLWINTCTCRSPTKINQFIQYSRFSEQTFWLGQATRNHYQRLGWLTAHQRIRRVGVAAIGGSEAAARGFTSIQQSGSAVSSSEGAILEKVDPSLKYQLQYFFNLIPE